MDLTISEIEIHTDEDTISWSASDIEFEGERHGDVDDAAGSGQLEAVLNQLVYGFLLSQGAQTHAQRGAGGLEQMEFPVPGNCSACGELLEIHEEHVKQGHITCDECGANCPVHV